jgi:hypothetical protein
MNVTQTTLLTPPRHFFAAHCHVMLTSSVTAPALRSPLEKRERADRRRPAPFSPSRRGAARAAAVRRRVAGSFSRLQKRRMDAKNKIWQARGCALARTLAGPLGRRVAHAAALRGARRRVHGAQRRCLVRVSCLGARRAAAGPPGALSLREQAQRRRLRPAAALHPAPTTRATPGRWRGARCHGPAGGRRAPRASAPPARRLARARVLQPAQPAGPAAQSRPLARCWRPDATTPARALTRAPLLPTGRRAAPCAGGAHGAPEHDGGSAAGCSGAAARRRRRS